MELNTILKNPLRVKARIAYVYPSLYHVMISGLAPDIIYYYSNKREDTYIERFTCSKLTGVEPEPRSLETKSRLRDFPLILTTLHYEPDIVNLTRLLIAGGIEVFSKNRESVVIAGGPVVMENPIPYSDIIDAFVIGEVEATLNQVVDLWIEYGDSKKRFLEELAELEYVYVPGVKEGEKITRAYVSNLDEAFYPVKQVENTEVEPVYGRGFKLEASRGCPFICGFCMETRVFQPYRERSLSRLKHILETGIQYTSSGRRVVVFSLSFPVTNTHYQFLEYLVSENYIASLPSLRINKYLEKSLDLIKLLGQKTLTLAPESLSHIKHSVFFKYPGMLDYIKQFIESVIDSGFNLKLYLIYGVKYISRDEVAREIEYLYSIAKYAKSKNKKITIGLNPLVPKPHTLFQWIGMLKKEELLEELKLYKSSLKSLVEAREYDIDWSIIQAQLALSPKPLGEFIYKWAVHGGGLAGWRRTIRETGLNYSYVYTGFKPGEGLPWEFIDLGEKTRISTYAQFEVVKKLLGFN